MAVAKKMKRKDLKKPDEFVQTGTAAVDWLTDHGRLVAAALGAILAVGVLLAVGSWYLEQGRVSAAAALGDALELADRPVLEEATERASDDPFFTSEEQKRNEVRVALEGVRKEHGGSAAAAVAALHLGDLAFAEGKHDEATSQYEAFLAETGVDHRLRFSALEGLGYAREAKGDREGALEAYERLASDGGEFYKPFALVHEARVLSALGRTDDARRRAQQVVDEYADAPAKRDAEAILAELPAAPVEARPEPQGEPAEAQEG